MCGVNGLVVFCLCRKVNSSKDFCFIPRHNVYSGTKREGFFYLLLSRQETTAFAKDVSNQPNVHVSELWKGTHTRYQHDDIISMSQLCILIIVSRFSHKM